MISFKRGIESIGKQTLLKLLELDFDDAGEDAVHDRVGNGNDERSDGDWKVKVVLGDSTSIDDDKDDKEDDEE